MIPDSLYAEGNIDDRQTKIEALGRVVNRQNQAYFEKMVRDMSWSGAIDITNWTLDAIIVLVRVCSDENLIITLKQGTRYFMPIHYPHESLLESFAMAILTGQL
jgi:hypothetical protein